MKFMTASCIAAFSLMAVVAPAATHAASLFSLSGRPDVGSTLVSVSYNHNTDELVATGLAFSVQFASDPTSNLMAVFGVYEVKATVDEFGVASSGEITVTGNPNAGPEIDLFRSTDLTAFEFNSQNLAFAFGSPTGALVGNNSTVVSIILGLGAFGTGIDFTDSFSATALVQADTFPVPTPASAAAGAVLLGGMSLSRRGRRGMTS